MLHRRTRPLLLTLTLLVGLGALSTAPAQAAEGFSLALDFGAGGFDARTDGLSRQVGTDAAGGFTSPIHGLWTPAAALRLGWNFFGHALVEGTLTATTWSPMTPADAGGGGFTGGRVTWFPLELAHPLKIVDLRKRNYDVGVSFGAGYTLLGGPDYGMDGAYLEYGVVGLFYPLKWLSVGLFYRHHQPMLSTFYLHFYDGVKTQVQDYSIGWGTIGLTAGVHFLPR